MKTGAFTPRPKIFQDARQQADGAGHVVRKIFQQPGRFPAIDDEEFAQADVGRKRQFLGLRPASHLVEKAWQTVDPACPVCDGLVRPQQGTQLFGQPEAVDHGEIARGVHTPGRGGGREWRKRWMAAEIAATVFCRAFAEPAPAYSVSTIRT